MDGERRWQRTVDEEPATVPLRPPERPARRLRAPHLPLRLLALLLLAGVLLLAVGRLTNLRLWPSLPNPFASRTVDRSQPVLLKAIEDLEKYKAASGNFQVLVDLERGSTGIPRFLKGERTLFVAAGSVDAEVDFSAIDKGAIRVTGDRSVDVTLPHARLSAAHIDPEHSYVASRQRGVLDRLGSVVADDPSSERALYRLAAAKMQDAATESGLVERAEQNTRAMLQSMLRSLGYSEVTVSFRDPPT